MTVAVSPEIGLVRLVADANRWLRRAELVLKKVQSAGLDQAGRQAAKEAADVLAKLVKAAGQAATELRKATRRSAGG